MENRNTVVFSLVLLYSQPSIYLIKYGCFRCIWSTYNELRWLKTEQGTSNLNFSALPQIKEKRVFNALYYFQPALVIVRFVKTWVCWIIPGIKVIRICPKVKQRGKALYLYVSDTHRCFLILPGDVSCVGLKGVLWQLYKISSLFFPPSWRALYKTLHTLKIILTGLRELSFKMH